MLIYQLDKFALDGWDLEGAVVDRVGFSRGTDLSKGLQAGKLGSSWVVSRLGRENSGEEEAAWSPPVPSPLCPQTVFLLWNSLNDPLFGWLSDRQFLSSQPRFVPCRWLTTGPMPSCSPLQPRGARVRGGREKGDHFQVLTRPPSQGQLVSVPVGEWP